VLEVSSLDKPLKTMRLGQLASLTVEAGALSLQTNMNSLTIGTSLLATNFKYS
jgi:hypothetical protein